MVAKLLEFLGPEFAETTPFGELSMMPCLSTLPFWRRAIYGDSFLARRAQAGVRQDARPRFLEAALARAHADSAAFEAEGARWAEYSATCLLGDEGHRRPDQSDRALVDGAAGDEPPPSISDDEPYAPTPFSSPRSYGSWRE